MEIILASGSPRRRELLERMGLRGFRVVVPHTQELLDPALTPAQQVERLSREKAEAVCAQAAPGSLIIAADTVVALDGNILGKPADEAQAREMLTALSGRSHQVYTGFTVQRGGEQVVEHEVTQVRFRALSGEDVAHYIAAGECLDKAGAYGIQGCGALLVEAIQGDYYNVMGLPIAHLAQVLGRFGVDCLALCAHV